MLVSGKGRRLHLGGAVVPAVVWCNRPSAGEVPDLQRLESASTNEPSTMNLDVDRDRLVREIEELALISDAPAPAVTRIVFTPTDLKARTWLIARCEQAGLVVRQDPVGNIFARWTGSDAIAPAVGTGSHIDAIPNAGRLMASSVCSEALRRYGRSVAADFVRSTLSNCSFLLRRSPHGLASAALAVGCSPEV